MKICGLEVRELMFNDGCVKIVCDLEFLVMGGSTLTLFISNLYGNFMTWEHLPDAEKSSLH